MSELERCRGLMAVLSQQLHYTLLPPGELLVQAAVQSEYAMCDYVQGTLQRLTNKISFQDAWSTAVRDSHCSLQNEDRRLICTLGDILGMSDLNTQEGQLALLGERLDARILPARAEAVERARLCSTLGALAGLGLVILLI